MGMMLHRIGLLEQASGGSGGGGGGDVTFDPTYLPSGHTLSNGNKTVENTSAGDNDPSFIPATHSLAGAKRYWEVVVDAFGPPGQSGYIGMVRADLRSDYDTKLMVVSSNGFGYNQMGTAWYGETQISTDPADYHAGDVLMFAYDPDANTVWVGKNGTWVDDPAAGTGGYTIGDFEYYPAGSCRDGGDVCTIRGAEAEYSYSIPTGFSDLVS